jgi:uncharacterized RDD family membrane protein YckC
MTHEGDAARDEGGPPSALRAETGPPSPYLQAGGAIPEAYLAPPQSGQPRYGTAPPPRPGQRAFRPAPPPRPGQPGNGQPRYGQPASGRARLGPRSGREAGFAAPWERAIASVLDWTIIFGVSIAIFLEPLIRFMRQMDAIVAHYQQGQNQAAAQTALYNLSRDPSTLNTIMHTQLAAFGIALVYYWIAHAAWGTTLGKRALGLRVVTAGDHARISIRAAGIRAVTFLLGPAVFLVIAAPLNVVGGALWLADALVAVPDPQTRALHDRLAGTVVIRKRWLDQQGGRASGL